MLSKTAGARTNAVWTARLVSHHALLRGPKTWPSWPKRKPKARKERREMAVGRMWGEFEEGRGVWVRRRVRTRVFLRVTKMR